MKIMKNLKSIICYDPVLFITLIVACISALFVSPSLEYFTYIDFHVLSLLLMMMLVVAGMQKVGLFSFIVASLLKLVHTTRMLAFVLMNVCFFSSMLITNDVALLTFVPLGIMMLIQTQKERLLIPIIVLQTIAANLGSMLTPLGNPQNLYLYSISSMDIGNFLKVMVVPSTLSFLILSASVFFIKSEKIVPFSEKQDVVIKRKKVIPWCGLFVICLLAVLRVIPHNLAFITVLICVIMIDKRVLFRADYALLLTFIFLFIFIGNIKNIPEISSALSKLVEGRELTVGILLSQIISNVPAAMLLSKFTDNYATLLLGVNLGGLGTLIASMASVISYKLYATTEKAQTGKYLAVFTAVNFVFLTILWSVTAFQLQFRFFV
ncbi:SLC13 family permease [Anaerotignum sp.]|uniref:SLC13 family permease n=1 Tax=Anaerotignum sp. TaxID=2039241 RepID=UPI0028A9EB58|nr:SLC13 family permease [Anaerotignum sp.]